MFVKPKFLPNSHVLLHLQLCVRPLWSADSPEPEYQQIQSRGELATWLQHNFSSARRKNRPRYVSLQVAAAMGVMCLVTGLIYLADFFFCLTQVFILETNFSLSFIILLSHTEEEIPRRQGILSSSPLILSHGKGWNKQKCTDSKRLPALNNQSEKGTATVGTFPADKNLRIGEWPARKLKGST